MKPLAIGQVHQGTLCGVKGIKNTFRVWQKADLAGK